MTRIAFRGALGLLCIFISASPQAAVSDLSAPPEAGGAWAEAVATSIRESEYAFTWQDHPTIEGMNGGWHAANRAQNLRIRFGAGRIETRQRTTAEPLWILDLELRRVGGVDATDLSEAAGIAEKRRDASVLFRLTTNLDPIALKHFHRDRKSGSARASDIGAFLLRDKLDPARIESAPAESSPG